ncbi:unnamed protein product, partial [Strongylus vulgaris]
MISDYPTLKETFRYATAKSYLQRLEVVKIKDNFSGGAYGIVDTSGEVWRDQRRFALHVLKDLGLGSDGMEQRLLFGYRFDEEHVGEFRELKNMISRQMRDFAHPAAGLVFMYPWLGYLPYFNNMLKTLISYRDAFYSFFDKQIEEHKKNINFDSDESNDYVEAYLKEQKKREAVGDDSFKLISYRDAFYSFFDKQIEEHKKNINFDSDESNDYVEAYLKEQKKREAVGDDSFSHLQLQNVCLDLWFAGMETTSNTLSWGAVYLLNNRDVQIANVMRQIQVKMQKELDREIGSKRAITMADKNNLPYTNAVIN